METQEDICSIEPCNAQTVLANLKSRFLDNHIYVSLLISFFLFELIEMF